jgi:biopolymer transport protein ExbB
MNISAVTSDLMALGASWVLWLLLALSIVSLAIIIERAAFFFSTRVDTRALRAKLLPLFLDGKLASASEVLGRSGSVEANVVRAGLLAPSPKAAEERMAAESGLQRLRSERNLWFLGTLGNNAPFVGLLGTVIGIIGAFGELEASGGQLSSGLMAEIGEALIATAVGLIVALPAVLAYNAFHRGIAVRLQSAEALGRDLLAELHLQAEKVVADGPTTGGE